MKSLTYVEIDVPYCSLTYGVAPCEATLEGENPTGTRKCFNTLATCQDRNNFSPDLVTLRFCVDAPYLPREIDAIPSVVSVDFNQGVISLGGGLGQRSSVTVTFRDHPWPDTGIGFDKYISDRDYDPFKRGSFWGRFRARFPFLRSLNLRVITGRVGQSLNEMQRRHFIIDNTDHSAATGAYTIIAKDILKLADEDRAQAPRLSNGVLSANIDDSETEITLLPMGIGDSEYPAEGLVSIGGKEICEFERDGDVLTIVRGQRNTEAVAHAEGDRVQLAIEYVTENPADILADLFQNYAGVGAEFIPIEDWRSEVNSNLGRFYSALIAEPAPVSDLASEVIEQAALTVWWNDLSQRIELLVLRGVSTGARVINEDIVLRGSVKSKEQPEKCETQIWTYFSPINPLVSLKEANNYSAVLLTRDGTAEQEFGSASIKKIFARWIPAFGLPVIQKMNDLRIARFRRPPRRIEFSTFRAAQSQVHIGEGAVFSFPTMQDDTGARAPIPIQITSVRPRPDRYEIEAEEIFFAPQVEIPEGDDDMPIGAILDFAGDTPPEGWLLCYGQEVSRTSFDALFSVIGTTYGVGDGSTTFNVPDCRDRTSIGKGNMGGDAAGRITDTGNGNPGLDTSVLGATGGVDRHTLTVDQMPSHNHQLGLTTQGINNTGPHIPNDNQQGITQRSTASAGGSQAHPNVQPGIVFNKIIRATIPTS